MSLNNIAPRSTSTAEQSEAEVLLGEFSALLRRLGSPDLAAPRDASLFLTTYQTTVLEAIELPAIARAYQHAALGQARELLALDAELAGEPLLKPFAEGSQQIGRAQLERLRPLRDERVAQRYLAAVESGQARGWHTLVYGIILAVYSWPLRQALMHYAHETISGLAGAADAAPQMDDARLRAAVDHAITQVNGMAQSNSMASP
jgi:urease accessory protein UreF